MAVSLAVLTEYTNVTERQTDTARWHRLRLCKASHDNDRSKNIGLLRFEKAPGVT